MNEENDPAKHVEVSFRSGGTRKCPYCQKEVEKEAVSCPYCHGTFVSTNRLKNAVGLVILFIFLYWIISSITSCEADREMKKIEKKVDAQMRQGYLR